MPVMLFTTMKPFWFFSAFLRREQKTAQSIAKIIAGISGTRQSKSLRFAAILAEKAYNNAIQQITYLLN